MPISKKILEEIDNLNIKDKEKTILIDVLNFEDEGLRNYTKKYEEVIGDYIKQLNSEEGE